MTTYAEYFDRAENHLRTAEAAAETDPTVAALCGLASAILATHPRVLRDHRTFDAEAYLAATADDTDPRTAATRAVAAAIRAGETELEDIAVDDCGWPSPAHSVPDRFQS
ncbi:hypothetical protein [Stackebrandtia soli]|uniref:hypothetical protein n=1 Tax=Stackebrandtia soli TaxID=1892856 RepID=UPI0039EBE42B